MTKITANERAVLEALADGALLSVPELFDLGRIPADRSAQGVHETAAHLARKGLLSKDRYHHRVLLKITPAGHEHLELKETSL
jgi:hypothetical protein